MNEWVALLEGQDQISDFMPFQKTIQAGS
jgi:hypothetical protein